ncbi:MAG: hypothetical protein H7331_03005 [Bacteroidia bacterium]|nr:hypothetical protein [Bacteroidia bacterium]
MNTTTISLAVFILLNALTSSAQFNLTWTKKLDKNNIQIYTAKPAKAAVNAVKAHTLLNTTPDKLLAFLLSPAMHTKNLPNCKYSILLKNNGDTAYYFHQQYDLPWPVTDREVVYLFKVKRLPNKNIAITSGIITDMIPLNKNYIRITEFAAQWQINLVAPNKTEAFYMALANPAGSIPAWFLNIFLVDGPYQSFKSMHDYFNETK